MTDYIACGKVVPERIADIVRGIAEGCRLTGTALVGGETAEHPGLLGEHEYDVAGAATGVVEADDVLGPERVLAGDVVIAMASSGLHSNGYSLVRRVLEVAGWKYDRHVDELGRTVGEELLEPTRLYTLACLALAARRRGAGARLQPRHRRRARGQPGAGAAGRRDGHRRPLDLDAAAGLRHWSARSAACRAADLERTLNIGVGMVAVVGAGGADAAIDRLARSGMPAWVLGAVAGDEDGLAGRGRGRRPRRQGRARRHRPHRGGAPRLEARAQQRPAPPEGRRRDGSAAQRPVDEVQAPYSSSSSLSVSSGAGEGFNGSPRSSRCRRS